ncbi:hypothetical protein [Asanoa ishikariensis]|nr:hypothetical protein [Asanoa ishikariensis]
MRALGLRIAAVGAVVLVLGGMLTWSAGLWPGADGPRAIVDHCYLTYDRQENTHSRCVGNWTRGDRGYSGPIHGVDVSRSWQATTVEPNDAGEWELTVPESAKRQLVLADSRQAWVLSPRSLPWVLTPVVPAALLLALGWSVTSLLRHLASRRRSASPRT